MKKDQLSQAILDNAMRFCDEQILEDKGIFKGKAQYTLGDYSLRIEVFKDEAPKKVRETAEHKIAKQGTPFMVFSFWNSQYTKYFKTTYGNPTPKDLAIFKNLLGEYDFDSVESMIRWYLKNYQELPSHHDVPSVPGLMGYRKTIAFKLFAEKKEAKKEEKNTLDDIGVVI